MRRNKVTRLGALLLSFIMICSTAACGDGKSDDASKDDASEGAVTEDEIDVSEVETFTVFLHGSAAANFNWDNPVAEEITRRTGVRLQPDYALEEPEQKVAMMLASGEYDDLILNVEDSMDSMVDAGAYIPLDDLIDTYGSNIKDFYGDLYDRIRYTDGSIYGIGIGASTAAELTPGFYYQVAYFVQNRALMEQGYPSVETLDELEEIIRKDIEAHPTTEDGQARYGLSLVTADGFRFQFSMEQPAVLSAGYPLNGQYIVKDDLSGVELIYRQDFFREYMRWYNKLYNDGLLDPESFTQSYDTYLAKIANGRVSAVIDGGWEFSSANQQLKDGSGGELAYTGFPAMTEAGGTWLGDQAGDVAQSGGFSITTACKNPEKLVNFFNFLASEEGQILTEWGIEGVNYTIDENGNRVKTPEDAAAEAADPTNYIKETGVKMYTRDVNEWLHQPYGYTTSNGQLLSSDSVESTDATYTDIEKEVLAEYGAEYHTDLFPDPMELGVREYGSIDTLSFGADEELATINQNFLDSRLPNMAEAIMCAPEEFDSVWDAYLQELDDMGIDKVIEALDAALQTRLEEWGVK